MKTLSTVFDNNGVIPSKYTCDGMGINPPLQIQEIHSNTKSLVLIVEDPDAPSGLWIHWMIWDIPPIDITILENSTPQGIVGKNSGGRNEWYHICPPYGEHRYVFKVFALDILLELGPDTTTYKELYSSMNNHIINQSVLIGRYSRV